MGGGGGLRERGVNKSEVPLRKNGETKRRKNKKLYNNIYTQPFSETA